MLPKIKTSSLSLHCLAAALFVASNAPVDGQVYEKVFSFTDVSAALSVNRGSTPFGGLIQGDDGSFYGTTVAGGANNLGTVFRMTPAGLLTTLADFAGTAGTNKGSSPFGGLVQGNDGNFYGTTRFGGANDFGTVFKVTPTGVLTTLVEFSDNGASNKGREPYASLQQGSDGNFYGTTVRGGANGSGTIFRVTPAGALTTLAACRA